MLNGFGPDIGPWGRLLVTGLQLGFVQLITSLGRAVEPASLSAHPAYAQQLLWEDLRGDSIQRCTKA